MTQPLISLAEAQRARKTVSANRSCHVLRHGALSGVKGEITKRETFHRSRVQSRTEVPVLSEELFTRAVTKCVDRIDFAFLFRRNGVKSGLNDRRLAGFLVVTAEPRTENVF